MASNLHKGIWLKKNAPASTSSLPTEHRYFNNGINIDASNAKDIRTSGDYFFLPAAGFISQFENCFYDSGLQGYYWLSTPNGNDRAYYMRFGLYENDYNAGVFVGGRNYSCLPLLLSRFSKE